MLVIGESSRAMNWGLYGYGRNTNPRLGAERNLTVFRDVVTQAAVTRISVPLILTRGSIEDEQRTARERSIVSVFREAGFQTCWISTQQRDPFTGAINRYPREADVTRFYERRLDGMTDLAGISIHDPETARLSVVGTSLGAIRRMVLGEPRPFDYDRWKLRPRASAPRPANRALN